MSKTVKITLIASAAVLVLGVIIAGIAFALGGTIANDDTKEVTHTVTEPFKKISVSVGAADVIISSSENGSCYAVCDESKNLTFTFEVKDGTLELKQNDSRRWFEFIGFQLSKKAAIYLPKGVYESLNAESASGNIKCTDAAFTFGNADIDVTSGSIEFASNVTGTLNLKTTSGAVNASSCSPASISAESSSGAIKLSNVNSSGKIDIHVSSGSVTVADSSAFEIEVEVSSGNTRFKNVVASSEMDMEASSGNINLEGCDAPVMNLECSSGNINATLRSPKMFDVHSSSGKTDYPSSVENSGSCIAKTNSGNIKIDIVS